MGRLNTTADPRRFRDRAPRARRAAGWRPSKRRCCSRCCCSSRSAAIEYGWMFLKQQQITNVARQAARLAATPTRPAATSPRGSSTLMNDAGLGSSGYTPDVTNLNTTPGNTLTVTISVNYRNITITHMADPHTRFTFPAPQT